MSGSILFISNGIGEDTIAAGVVRVLRETRPEISVLALPLVGEGSNYRPVAEIVGPRRMMPSGGLIPAGVGNLLLDLRSGLAGMTLAQTRLLGSLRRTVSLGIPVGDAFPVAMAGLFLRRPLVFVGTAKSNWFCPYSPIEKWLFRKFCRVVFPRDEPTAQTLRDSGIQAAWAGNAMMDCLDITGEHFGVPGGGAVVAILPGSRKEAYGDLPTILGAVEVCAERHDGALHFLMAPAGSLDMREMAAAAAPSGWALRVESGASPESCEPQAPASDGAGAQGKARAGKPGQEGTLVKGSIEIPMIKGKFGDVINSATIVLGQAGTGNEQAVGLGKPVVAFDSEGKSQMGWYRARQKGLLGPALSVVEKDPQRLGGELAAILASPERYQAMAAAGLARMGPPGAAQKMAARILEVYDSLR